jgi:hypothetical protein
VTVGDRTARISIDQAREQPVAVEGTEFAVQVRLYYADFIRGEDGTFRSRSDIPRNPAVEYAIEGPKGAEPRIAFAANPAHSDRSRASADRNEPRYAEVQVRYEADVAEQTPPGLTLFLGPQEDVHFALVLSSTEPITGRLAMGSPVPIDIVRGELELTQFLPHARRVRKVVDIPPPPKGSRAGKRPAIRVALHGSASSEPVWLVWGEEQPLRFADQMYTLVLSNPTRRLPFRIELEDVIQSHYPGTGRPSMWRSLLWIDDERLGERFPRVVEVNEPTEIGGYTFFQSDYPPRPQETSGLSVSRDPGLPIVFAGYLLVTAGMLVVLGQRIRLFRRLRASHARSQTLP